MTDSIAIADRDANDGRCWNQQGVDRYMLRGRFAQQAHKARAEARGDMEATADFARWLEDDEDAHHERWERMP